MKTLALIATAALGLFAASSLHAQDTTTSTTTTTTTKRRVNTRSKVAQTTSSATISARNNARFNSRLRASQTANVSASASRLDGGVVRAVRSDNPLQAVNPLAPAEYGSGEQVTRHDPDDPFQRAQGLKLLVVEF